MSEQMQPEDKHTHQVGQDHTDHHKAQGSCKKQGPVLGGVKFSVKPGKEQVDEEKPAPSDQLKPPVSLPARKHNAKLTNKTAVLH